MADRPLPLGPFLAELAERLDGLGPAGVRATIELRAAVLRPSERAEFLALFDATDATDATDAANEAGSVEPAEAGHVSASVSAAVDADIEHFATSVARLGPRHRWRWRDRWDDEDDDLPDAEGRWAEDLLVAIGEQFLAGDLEWAASAYGRVFRVLASTFDDDRGLDLAVDRTLASEARNRWLWAIAVTCTDPDEGAADMVGALDQATFAADLPTLDEILTARPGDPPVSDGVLRSFAAALVADHPLRPAWASRRWLDLALQTLERLDGIDAVVESARRERTPSLETYCWLVDRVAAGGDSERAIELGEEALAATSNSYAVADLADLVASMWRESGRPEQALAAQCRSWECRPTVRCLERVLDAAEEAGQPGVPAAVSEHPPANRFLQVALHLLAGSVDEALRPPDRGAHHPSRDRYGAERLAVVAACQSSIGGIPAAGVRQMLAGICSRAQVAGWIDLGRYDDTRPATPLAERLETAMGGFAAEPSRLTGAQRLVDALAERVLGAKDRPAYEVVAALVVFLASTTSTVDGSSAAAVIDGYDHRYRRFSAFRAELRDAREAGGL